jgi:hypothetical protein
MDGGPAGVEGIDLGGDVFEAATDNATVYYNKWIDQALEELQRSTGKK